MIRIGDMVGFYFEPTGEWRLAIILDDLGVGWRYGRFTGLLVGGEGDYIPLNPEECTLLSTRTQVEAWERKNNLKKILDKHS